MDLSRLRNLSIVAHIDHGKTTLADRILELSGAVDPRDMRAQYLDSMDLERERGITIKLQSVRLDWHDHVLNLIDTPGHVDFGYEVSRSLAACEGVILLVDAAQGIEAQTLANCYLALENDLEIVAVPQQDRPARRRPRPLRRGDREGARHPRRRDPAHQRQDRRGRARAARRGDRAHPGARRAMPTRPLQALIFDSHFDQYRGVVSLGPGHERHAHDRRRAAVHAGRRRPRRRRGRRPQPRATRRWPSLGPGETGYLIAGIKDVRRGPLGRDRHRRRPPAAERPGRATATPSRWCSAGSTRSTATSSPTCGRRWRSCGSTTRSFTYEPETSRRPRLRVPLRLPRPAPHGDRPRAARARVRPRPHRHGAVGRLPRAQDERRAGRGRQPVGPARRRRDRATSRSRASPSPSSRRPTTRARSWTSARRGGARCSKLEYLSPERVELIYQVPLAEVVHRLLRPAQEPHPGLRQPRLRARRLRSAPTS